eukprot:5657203-Amphidinium_carterae.1
MVWSEVDSLSPKRLTAVRQHSGPSSPSRSCGLWIVKWGRAAAFCGAVKEFACRLRMLDGCAAASGF